MPTDFIIVFHPGSRMGVSHQIGSKHLKLPVTDDFAGVVKISKLFKRDLPAKGDQIWYFHFCGVILLRLPGWKTQE
jgi:hypothetical protein